MFSQHEGKPLRLHVKVGWMWIQKHVMWLQWSDNWKNVKGSNPHVMWLQWSDNCNNVKGSNPKLVRWLLSLKLRLPISLQYLKWHWANKNHGMAQFLDCWKGLNAKYDG
jgi:hypothetical protein